ncbi:MAG: DUF5320 domain-containing protein [Thermodesulforhabdaceae bacterium]
MPGGDRTGPWGLGPMTGRAAGFCAGYGMPGFMNPIPGRGFWGWGWRRGGRGLGWGRGFRHRWFYRGWYSSPFAWGWGEVSSPEDRKAFLKDQLQALNDEMEAIRRELELLEKGAEEK